MQLTLVVFQCYDARDRTALATRLWPQLIRIQCADGGFRCVPPLSTKALVLETLTAAQA